MKIYVASSWRNPQQPEVVARLRAEGHDVYDFKAPDPGGTVPGGFQWREIDPNWKSWTPEQYVAAVDHPIAQHGLGRDFAAMVRSDACVMVQPCGVSAALELGWMLGAGKIGVVLLDGSPPRWEPELMLRLAHHLSTSLDQVVERLRMHERSAA